MKKPWYVWVGKIAPWAVAAVATFLKEVLEIDVTWWPVFSSLLLGVIQFVISMFKPKEP